MIISSPPFQVNQELWGLLGSGGSFQTVQGRVASSTERGVAGRASKRLDLLGMAMRAIPDQGAWI